MNDFFEAESKLKLSYDNLTSEFNKLCISQIYCISKNNLPYFSLSIIIEFIIDIAYCKYDYNPDCKQRKNQKYYFNLQNLSYIYQIFKSANLKYYDKLKNIDSKYHEPFQLFIKKINEAFELYNEKMIEAYSIFEKNILKH